MHEFKSCLCLLIHFFKISNMGCGAKEIYQGKWFIFLNKANQSGCLLVQIESFSAVLTLFDNLNPVCEMPAFHHPVSYPQYQIRTLCIHPGEEINSIANPELYSGSQIPRLCCYKIDGVCKLIFFFFLFFLHYSVLDVLNPALYKPIC